MFYYGSRLPHWHPPGHELFLTVRLADSLPAVVVTRLYQEASKPADDKPADTQYAEWLAAQRRLFAALEHQLEYGEFGATWLALPAIQQSVLAALLHQHRVGRYTLLAACVMPNHLHAVIRLLPAEPDQPFRDTWAYFKRYTGREANRLLQRNGRFWTDESYDHVVRDGERGLGQAIRYTAFNPVKARLCANWSEWPGTWVADDWRDTLVEPRKMQP